MTSRRRIRTATLRDLLHELQQYRRSDGNPFASLAFGYGDNINASSQLVVTPSVANKSLETGFYVQDDWKVTPKLTVNLGLRYQWSSPYTSRGNQIEFSNFTANSGVNIDLTSLPAAAQQAGAMSAQGQMQSAGLNYPASQAGARHNAIPDVEHEDDSDLLERPWAEAGFLVPTRSADGGAGRGGHLFRNEPGHKLPVSRLGVPQDGEHIFYERQFRHPIRDPGESVSRRALPVRRVRSTASLRTGVIRTRTI